MQSDHEHLRETAPDTVPAPREPEPAHELAAPVTGRERITAIDVLRGVAVFGILVMNIKAFSMVGAAYANPMAHGQLEGVNLWVWLVEHHLFDMKMMSIFSMLYGAGVVLMTERAAAQSGHSAGVHYRRTGWLILFGLIHAHVIWHGDILFAYGMCGLLLYLFRRFPPVLLIALGLCSMLVSTGLMLAVWLVRDQIPPEGLEGMMNFWAPSAEAIAEETEAFRGGWLSQATYRNILALNFEIQGLIFFGWKLIGNMLLGMGLYKLGAFSAAWSTRAYALLVVVGAAIGLPLVSLGVRANEASDWAMMEGMFLNGQYNYWGSLFIALAWIGVVMLVVRSGALSWLVTRLAAVGRMALTNYILQSVICTLIFYGHGFGRFEMLDRWQQQLVVLAICAVQLVGSRIWLLQFRFGPLEWLWRSLTYWRPQPMRRSS